MTRSSDVAIAAIDAWLSGNRRPQVVGLCGAQGSGKSTLAAALASHFTALGRTVAVLSLDDLYLPPEARPVHIHPLFATRGVPGTHDPHLGIRVLDALKHGQAIALPRFDKANDRPFAPATWPVCTGTADLILFEGWCVGAVAQPDDALKTPVNGLERDEDTREAWRRHVNAQLSGPYADLFARLDRLILLAAPGFEVVQAWRTEQEHALRDQLAADGRTGDRLMDDAAVGRFVQHYERLTRHILAEMPGRADLTLRLDAQRRPYTAI